ncbi:hypothetical protein GCM10023196_081770 [Actinoallomurus vinaceus]|uniref:Integral membrane protein n=1 Tax=Actinoallomurus vinaceus TaxID=1080074 RepID=A0ABP8UN87_9ACTN
MTSRSTSLEHRLRRWLRLYPIDQREEMLGVLLATAGPGQERPTPRDAADLAWGAVRVRLRREIRSLGGPIWRDAFAVLGLVATALVSTGLIAYFRDDAVVAGFSPVLLQEPAQVWPMWAPWPAVAALSLLGLRRTAAGLAWAATLSQLPWLAVAQGHDAIDSVYVGGNLLWFGLAILAATALSLSGGLRPAFASLGGLRGAALMTGVAAFAFALIWLAAPLAPMPQRAVLLRPVTVHNPAWLLAVASLTLIGVACARPRSASGRRSTIVVLLALSPLASSLVLWSTPFSTFGTAAQTLYVAGPLTLLAIMGVALASRLRRQRRSTS